MKRQNMQPHLSKPHFCVFYSKNAVGEARLAELDQNKAHEVLIWPQTQIFSLTNYKKKFSFNSDCR